MKHVWFDEPRAVELYWQDAQSILEGWQDTAALNDFAKHEETARIRTVGMLCGHSRHYWIIVGCNQGDALFHAHVQRIPKGCVTFFRWLKPAKWQRARRLKPLKRRRKCKSS